MLASKFEQHPLIHFLRDPCCAEHFDHHKWERLFRSARLGYLASRVGWLARQSGIWDKIPLRIRFHLDSALQVSASQSVSVLWEVTQIEKAFAKDSIPFVLLKGAGYVKGQLQAAHGRIMSDVDIMVPKRQLGVAEKALYEHGWFPTKIDAYDQRYYRKWMHELPPMQHLDRGTSIDVHHTILPPTARLKPDTQKLWNSAIELEAGKRVLILSPHDMILHSASHLFHDGELEHGLRDLADIVALLNQFSEQPHFFEVLIDRAIEHELTYPLYYALKYSAVFLRITLPANALAKLARFTAQSGASHEFMDLIVINSIGSILDDSFSAKSSASQFAMYVRSHYLRMPLHQLLPHLLRKQFIKDSK